jgi:hypothetical protein
MERKLANINRLEERKIIIIRRFISSSCGEYVVDGKKRKFNAAVVEIMNKERWKDADVFACLGSLPMKVKLQGEFQVQHFYPGTGWEMETEESAERYDSERNYYYSVQKIFHDDRCGTGDEANAYIVRFSK